MIPLRDDIPSRTFPVVNYGIIALNIFVFFLQLSGGSDSRGLVERFAMVPARISYPDSQIVQRQNRMVVDRWGRPHRIVEEHELPDLPFHPYWTLLTCIFLHGGWMHLIGNCWFLYIFGDNVEDRLGHLAYVVFYALSGIGASLIQWYFYPDSIIPTIGASGAIAGVMGAYFLFYPQAHVITLIPIIIFLQIAVVPAWVFLGVWFVFQFLSGSAALAGPATGGVAWWAHVGGFVVGVAIVVLLKSIGLTRQKPTYQPSPVSTYRYRRGI